MLASLGFEGRPKGEAWNAPNSGNPVRKLRFSDILARSYLSAQPRYMCVTCCHLRWGDPAFLPESVCSVISIPVHSPARLQMGGLSLLFCVTHPQATVPSNPSAPRDDPPSPCLKQCKVVELVLDDSDALTPLCGCCGRTTDDIAGWQAMSPPAKRAVDPGGRRPPSTAWAQGRDLNQRASTARSASVIWVALFMGMALSTTACW